MNYDAQIARKLDIRKENAKAVIDLLDSGNTVPFIARYRKEMTGSLDEEQIRDVQSALEHLRSMDERRSTILSSIEEQNKLTPELRLQIENADTLTALEDLYLPYKPKRRTRASIAREKGLEGLADLIIKQPRNLGTPEEQAVKFLSDQVLTVEEALAGARDIVAEQISDHADVRRMTREKAMLNGVIVSTKIDGAIDERGVYELYYQFENPVQRMRPYQVLALDRAETEKVLRVKLATPEKDWQIAILAVFRADMRSTFFDQFQQAMMDAAERLLLPAIERDIRRTLTESAWKHAILVFANNLKALLMQPPLAGQCVLGIDPGFRTGSKVAVVNETGKLLDITTIYPHEPQKKMEEALKVLFGLVGKHRVTLISIGNGTASRETEQMVVRLIKDYAPQVRYIITSEAGASVYSASPLAKTELPGLDVSLRGAVSIARRVQDPLAELVKIEPKAIGIGLYQHDVDQHELTRTLAGVVEDVVNKVGVDLNTASPALLEHVAGIGPKLAEKIVAYREENGPFINRKQLLKVPGLGPKAFEQSAGFLRIRGGSNPLDASAIHPESYQVAEKIIQLSGISMESSAKERLEKLNEVKSNHSIQHLAGTIGCGELTLSDIFEQLAKPGRDPRAELPAPILRSDVLKIEDLSIGMTLKGTVRNVVDFGAFVDIGVKQDGLLHRSQMKPGTVVQLGDIIEVEIVKVELEKGRIGLKLKP